MLDAREGKLTEQSAKTIINLENVRLRWESSLSKLEDGILELTVRDLHPEEKIRKLSFTVREWRLILPQFRIAVSGIEHLCGLTGNGMPSEVELTPSYEDGGRDIVMGRASSTSRRPLIR